MDSATPDVPDEVLRRRLARYKWNAANPEKVKAIGRAVYARKVAADPGFNMRKKAAAMARNPEKFRAQSAAQAQRHRERKRWAAANVASGDVAILA